MGKLGKLAAGVVSVILLVSMVGAGMMALQSKEPKSAAFLGVGLGMTETMAFKRMNRMGSGALIGALCAGNYGVGAYITYGGLEWQLMAHTIKGKVNEIKLYRYDSQGTSDNEQCQAAYRALLKKQRTAYSKASWAESSLPGDGFKVRHRAHATLADGTVIKISAERLDWERARCLIELRIIGAQTSSPSS